MRLTNVMKQKFVNAVLADIPSVDYLEKMRSIISKDAYDKLPEEGKTLFNNLDTKHMVSVKYLYIPVGVGSLSVQVPNSLYVLEGKAKLEVDSLITLHTEQSKKRTEVSTRLASEIMYVTTDTKLRELYPDLVKYMPTEMVPVTQNLPAAESIMNSLKKLGLKVEE